MTDFTTLKTQFNTGASDASPTWTDMLFGTANYEFRLCGTGVGNGTTASASWFTYTRPASTGVIPEMWGYVGSDNSGGLKLSTYDGTSAHYMQWRINWDNTGTFASAPIISAWKDNTLPGATPGSQPGTGDGSAFVNGSTDTSNLSYIHANAYGFGVTSGGVQQTPAANAAGTLAPGSHSASGAATTSSAAWLATWQDLQAATNWIANGATPQATTSGFWYTVFAFYTGPNMTGGTLVPVLGFQYTWI